MFKPSGYPGRRPKPQPGNPQYQTQQHALPQSLGPPPPLSDLHRWFDYFDHDRSGGLDQEEVISGLIQTHPNLKSQIVREQVYAVWSSFDSDGNGTVDRREFCQQGGLGEALLSATTGAQHHTYTPHAAERGLGGRDKHTTGRTGIVKQISKDHAHLSFSHSRWP